MRGRVLVVKTGCTFPELAAVAGDFEDWIAAGLGAAPGRLLVRRPSLGEALPDPSGVAGVVVAALARHWDVSCGNAGILNEGDTYSWRAT